MALNEEKIGLIHSKLTQDEQIIRMIFVLFFEKMNEALNMRTKIGAHVDHFEKLP